MITVIKEPTAHINDETPQHSFWDNARSLPSILKHDVAFRRFVFIRSGFLAYYFSTPFLALHALMLLACQILTLGASSVRKQSGHYAVICVPDSLAIASVAVCPCAWA